jgi:hypothetical protein
MPTMVSVPAFKKLEHEWKREEIDKIRRDMRKNPERYENKALLAELRRLEGEWNSFCNDPMTQAYGIAGDFHDDYMKRGRMVFAELCKRGVCEYDGDCMTDSRWGPFTHRR